jgi:hypothetical protein
VLCSTCGERDTLMHRITECGEGREIWKWTRKRIAWILRTDPVWIPQERTLRPQFHIWPPRRHRAVLWIIAHMVWYRIQESRTPSAQENFDFLRRARWKAYQDTGRMKKIGNYLTILGSILTSFVCSPKNDFCPSNLPICICDLYSLFTLIISIGNCTTVK